MPKNSRKFVVWLYNTTDKRDDEWLVIWGSDKSAVLSIAETKYDKTRFTLGDALTVNEFKKEHKGFPIGKATKL
jgi:hypothetical protein